MGGLLAAGCSTESVSDEPIHNEPIAQGFELHTMDSLGGIYATYRAGDVALRLESIVDGDNVEATVRTEDNQLITSLTVAIGVDQDIAADLGTLARAAAAVPSAVPSAELLPHYSAALQEMFDATGKLDRSTVRMALLWQEEVLIRRLAVDTERDTWWDDQPYNLDGDDVLVHTNLMVAPHVQAFRSFASEVADAEKCDLGCSWYDVCCHHDEACVNCGPWYCSTWCVVGCFGGDCGGGR